MADNRPPKKIIDLELAPFVLEFRDKETGRWTTSGPQIIGHSAAFDVLKRTKEDPKNQHLGWRVLRRELSEAYQSGWKDAQEYTSGSHHA